MKNKLNKLLSLSVLFLLIVACSQVPGIFVGKDTAGYIDEVGINAEFNKPTGLCLDDSGNLFVADSKNKLIRKVTPEGKVSTFAGVQGDNTVLGYPFDCAFDSKGNLYISNDGEPSVINKVTPDGKVSVFAGGGDIRYNLPKEGIPATEINISSSKGIAIDSKDNVYVLFGGIVPDGVAIINQDGNAFVDSHIIEGPSNYWITINKENDNFYFVTNSTALPSSIYKNSLVNKKPEFLLANYNFMFDIPFWETRYGDYDSYRSFGSMTLDKNGNIYILNRGKPCGILKILKDEKSIEVIIQISEDNDLFISDVDLAIDKERNILYLSSSNKNKIYKIFLK